MTKFHKDLEVLINEGVIAPNGKQIRFVFKYGNRLKGDLELLNLTDRSYNCLRRNGLHDIKDVANKWDSLMQLKHAGAKSVKDIRNKFLAYYYETLDCDEERKEFWIDTITATVNMK